jgi:hypothetical protein
MIKQKLKKYFLVLCLVVVVFGLKTFVKKSNVDHAAAATPDHVELTGSGTAQATISHEMEMPVYDMSGTLFASASTLDEVVFTISPSAGVTATCDGVAFGDTMPTLSISEPPTKAVCELIIDTAGTYRIEAAGFIDTWSDFNTTEDPTWGYDLVVGPAPAMDRLEVTGTKDVQIGGTYQTLTITAYNDADLVHTAYTGDKAITLSGPVTDANGNAATCVDKNSNEVAFNSPTTLTFIDGVATCKARLYKSETTSVDATDGSYHSNDDPSYDHDVTVINPTLAVNKPSQDEACAKLTLADELGNPYTDETFDVRFALTEDSVNRGQSFSPTIVSGAEYSSCYRVVATGVDKVLTFIDNDAQNEVRKVAENSDFAEIITKETYIKGKFYIRGKKYRDKTVELRHCSKKNRKTYDITKTKNQGKFIFDDVRVGKTYCVEASQKKQITEEDYFIRMELYKQRYEPTFGKNWWKKFYKKYRTRDAKPDAGIVAEKRYYRKYRVKESFKVRNEGENTVKLTLK